MQLHTYGYRLQNCIKRTCIKYTTQTLQDCLSFVSLSRQIDAGVKSGYQKSEIVEAVIRAVSPSLKLRPYLEMMDNLSLGQLKQILRPHFKEKTGTELYQELTLLCQGPKESAQDFLMRAMNLREQVLFSSQKGQCCQI